MVPPEAKLSTSRYQELPFLTLRDIPLVSFNQGVGSSSLPRLTKATRQDSPPNSWKNQGVRTPGQPTP